MKINGKIKLGIIRLGEIIPPVLITLFLLFKLAYWQKIYPGIRVAQIPLGNQTQRQAEETIQKTIKERQPYQLRLNFDNQVWEIDLKTLGLTYHPEQTIAKAYGFGRNKNPWQNLKDYYQALTKGENFGLTYSLNQELLTEKIATISSQIFIPAIPPSLSLKSGKIILDPGKDGQELDRESLLKSIDFQIKNLITTPIFLPVKKTSLMVDEQTLKRTRLRAQSLLGKKIILKLPDQNLEIKDEEILTFLSFQDDYDLEKIENYVSPLATLVDKSAQDALFRFESGKVIVFRPSKNGTLVDKTKTVQLIKQGLKELEEKEEKEKSIKLPVEIIEPKIKIGDINRFGIREKIGEGKSTFRGSILSRQENIQLASGKLSGILVPPGGEFSFNQSLGEVSEKTGFKQAYIIKEGKTILGDGGGVCQVSTTLFRAVLNAGLPILERQNHAYRVSYYEQDSPPGFDATVFEPNVDLRFQNDTPAYILIQSTVDLKTQTLVFEIYGTNDGRKVTISEPRIWDQVPPPPDLYQDDPSLPAGTVKQVDWKAWGAKVAFTWKVTRSNEILQERTFYSYYRPWQAVYRRGTKPRTGLD